MKKSFNVRLHILAFYALRLQRLLYKLVIKITNLSLNI